MRTLRAVLVGTTVVVLLGGLGSGGIAQTEQTDAGPASTETLFELTVPSEALPDDIMSFKVGDLTVVAGADASDGDDSASQANESMRARGLLVKRGELIVEPTSDTLVWRVAGGRPEVATDGEAVTLTAGEAIFLPAIPQAETDTEKYLRIANPGSEEALVLSFHAHSGDQHFGGYPQGVSRASVHTTAGYPRGISFEGVDVLFRLMRLTGEPGAAVPLPSGPALAIFIVESGILKETTIDSDGEATDRTWGVGIGHVMPIVEGRERSLVVAGDDAASALELVAIPLPAE